MSSSASASRVVPPVGAPSQTTTTTTTQDTTTTATTSKKKFGKNLNKLTKPPAPPASSTTGSAKQNSSRNCLLLLSTKRNNATTAASSSLLAGKSSSMLGSSSSSDGMLSAAVLGGFRGDQASSHVVAGAGAASQQSSEARDVWGAAVPNNASASSEPSHATTASSKRGNERKETDATYDRSTANAPIIAATNEAGFPATGNVDTDQKVAMSQYAHDRAEIRWTEENTRMMEQKERAAQRLHDLESKMESQGRMERSSTTGVVVAGSSSSGGDDPRRMPSSPRGKGGGRDRTTTLFDPNNSNRTYSSLVGVHEKQQQQQREEGNVSDSILTSSHTEYGRGSPAPASPARYGMEYGLHHPEDNSNMPMIQLASYEDRSRGDRSAAAAPRMLFDPKSGSMVAVSARKEGPVGGGRDQGKRSKTKARNSRDKEKGGGGGGGGDSKQTNGDIYDTSILKKKQKGRKDDALPRRTTTRRNADPASEAMGGKDYNNMKLKQSPAAARGSKSRQQVESSRLPRTSGVLYERDDLGNCICADGCDGDQGYGAHSVPGGRMKNARAHATFVEQQQQLYQQESQMYDVNSGYLNELEEYHMEEQQEHDRMHKTGAGSGSSNNNGGFAPLSLPAAPIVMDWVKPNEKIELVMGIDDSPTLQATANPWAPSEAVLAAAVAAKQYPQPAANEEPSPPSVPMHNMRDFEDDDFDENEEDGAPSFIGLGFDPTEHIDSVMMSPTVGTLEAKEINSLDFGALSLADAGTSAESATRNIFAFGASPWGTDSAANRSTSALSDWALGSTGNRNDAFGKKEMNDNGVGPSSFLSLSSLGTSNKEGNTWGTSGLPSLGGTTLSSAQAANEHGATRTAD